MLPEERARVKIDKQLSDAGWDIVARDEYVPFNASAVKEALMQGNKESDYFLFIDDKAIAVVEAKAEDNALGGVVARQAEWYSQNPQGWVNYGSPVKFLLFILQTEIKYISKICLNWIVSMLSFLKCTLQRKCFSCSAKNRSTVPCLKLREEGFVTVSIIQR